MSPSAKTVLFTGVMLASTLAAVEGVSWVGWKLLLGRAAADAGGVDTSAMSAVDPHLGTRLSASECTSLPYGLHDHVGSFREDTPSWDLCTNSMGWRTPEFEEAKPPGTFRMVCLGDSHTMGQGVAVEATYCRLLGARLAPLVEEAGLRMEVINAGVWGQSSFQGLIVYEKFARHWDPDLVTVGFGSNDRAPLGGPGRAVRDRLTYALPGESPSASRLSYSSRDPNAVRLVKVALRSVRERRYAARRDTAVQSGDVPLEQRRSSPVEYEENLGRLLDRIREDGAEPVVVGIAIPEDVYQSIQREVARSRDVPHLATWTRFDELEPAVRAGEIYAEERDLIDSWLTETGRQVPRRWSRYLTSDGSHPSIIGHEIIAADLYELAAPLVRDLATRRAAERRP